MKACVMGGDKRFEYLKELLAQNGVRLCAHIECDTLVLPYPVTRDGKMLFAAREEDKTDLRQLFGRSRGKTVLAGGVPDALAQYALECGVHLIDYALDEELLVKNAMLTAEGAVRLYSEATERSVLGARIVVTGFGRVARAVCRAFHLLGASIAVAARSPEALETARSRGFCACELTLVHELCEGAHALINTVPARVVDENAVRALEDKFYFELASPPFGADLDALTREGVRVVAGAGLPGRYMPASAAEVLLCAINKHIQGGQK